MRRKHAIRGNMTNTGGKLPEPMFGHRTLEEEERGEGREDWRVRKRGAWEEVWEEAWEEAWEGGRTGKHVRESRAQKAHHMTAARTQLGVHSGTVAPLPSCYPTTPARLSTRVHNHHHSRKRNRTPIQSPWQVYVLVSWTSQSTQLVNEKQCQSEFLENQGT